MRVFSLLLLTTTVFALPLNIVEEMLNGLNRKLKDHNLSPAGSAALKQVLGSNMERRKERLKRMSRLVKVDNTTEGQNKVKKELLALPDIAEEQSPSLPKGIFELNDDEGVSEYLFQGDIQLTDDQLDELEQDLMTSNATRRKRQASTVYRKWTGNTVYYFFDASIAETVRSITRSALAYVSANTCLSFVESSTAANRIRVYRGAGCFAYMGMNGGVQDLSLGSGCEHFYIIVHEFMHALGVHHTQMRADRDNYLTINTAAIDPQNLYNFDKLSPNAVINYTPYEYGSVMQYSANSFARGTGLSMVPKDNRFLYTMGSGMVSFYDLKVINDHYGCTARCPAASSASCQNGGTPNPRNCATCICPLGYGGTLCNQRPSGCGESMVASSHWQTKSYSYGNQNDQTVRRDFAMCNHWISAPAGQKVQVKITGMYNAQCNYGCVFNGIEIKVGNKQETNPRYCCETALSREFTSELNPTPIISYNRFFYTTFTIQYRAIGGSVSPVPAPAPAPAPASCRDTNVNCVNWLRNGKYCNNAFYPLQDKIDNCAKSCNLC